MNLYPLKIINTRPEHQASKLSKLLRQHGGAVFDIPALAIAPTEDGWLQMLPDLLDIDQVIFTSRNAVDFFCAKLNALKTSWPTKIKITCIGKATANALDKFALNVDFMPLQANSDKLLALDNFKNPSNQTILLIKGIGGHSQIIAAELKNRGAKVLVLDVYQRVPPPIDVQKIEVLWHNRQADIIIFTSCQAMQSFLGAVTVPLRIWLQQLTWLVISERLADEAKKLGVHNIIVATPDNILPSLYEFKQGLIHDERK